MANFAFNFQASWNPGTSTPNLAGLTLNNTTDKYKLWVASASGSNSITGSPLSYAIGEGVYWSGTAWIKATAADIAPSLGSKIFVVPADFDWSGDLSSFANTEMIVSNYHQYSSAVNLPTGVTLKFNPGGRLTGKSVNKIPTLDLTVGWTTNGNASVIDADSFQTTTNGRVFKSGVLVTGRVYTVHIKAKTIGTNYVEILDSSSNTVFISGLSGEFDVTATVKYTETASAINIRSVGAGRVDIEVFELFESYPINSPITYGDLSEQLYPLIDNPKGNIVMNGASLTGMFKLPGDIAYMSDFFAGTTYNDVFLDSFVRTTFWFEKSLIQTGGSPISINTGIANVNWKNYKGLSEGCSVEGTDGVTVSNFYTFATGDFSVKNVTILNGRINICNMYAQDSNKREFRPLRFQIENLVGTDFRIGNEYPHPAAKSVLTTPTICNVRLVATGGRQNMINLFSVIGAFMKDIQFSYDVYVGGDINNSGGQPLVLSSSVNGYYINVNADKGDSGMMFWMFLPQNLEDSVAWIDSHAIDFKGFKRNTIRGGKYINMYEEGWTCDSTDSLSNVVTMNRNRFKIISIIDSQNAQVEFIHEESESSYPSLINTIMTSITKGKFGKYSEILSVVHEDGNPFNILTVKGPGDFFTGAAINDQYAVTYGFYDNVVEDMTFTNCSVPILFYLYAFRNTIRNIRVEGGYQGSAGSVGKGNTRQLSYSARRKRCYIAPCIDNVFEKNYFDGNGLQIIDAKHIREYYNPWLNSSPETEDLTISEDGEMGTVIRNNIIKNANVRLQGLRGATYEGNTLINVKKEIVDTTFIVNSNIIINEPDNDDLDDQFAAAEAVDNMLIPVVSVGDGSGYTRITLRIGQGAIIARITGNASLYNDAAGSLPSRTKTFSTAGADIFLYFRCFNGAANIAISNASNITHLGGTADAVLKYDATNSADLIIQKGRFLPKAIQNIKQTAGALSLKGNTGNLPDALINLQITDSNSLVEGKIAGLPRLLEFIHLKFPMLTTTTPSLKGDLADLSPSCTYFHDETKAGMYTYSTKTWPNGMRKVYFRLSLKQWWTADMVDQLLEDLSAASWTGEKVIDIASNAPNPVTDPDTQFPLPDRTAASNPYVTTLNSKGVAITINGVLQ